MISLRQPLPLYYLCLLLCIAFDLQAFTIPATVSRVQVSPCKQPTSFIPPARSVNFIHRLDAGSDDNSLSTRESDELVLGTAGTGAALVMMYSEFVLSQTGCGLPAGPFGLVGAVEGISYLSVVGLVAYSLYKKITTVSASYDYYQ